MPVRKKTVHAQRAPATHVKHHSHSPFVLIWEIITLASAIFIGISFLDSTYFHFVQNHDLLHQWVLSAEIILVAEITLLFLVARKKFYFIEKNWPTILAVLPFGSGFRVIQALKVGWHAAEKTRVIQFLKQPAHSVKNWLHRKLYLRIEKHL
ncbi:MAG: hypothetical protein AABY11_03710 [archaeon]